MLGQGHLAGGFQIDTTPDRTTLTAFFGAVVIGGTNFVAVRFSNEELEPLFGAALRFGAATLLFFAIMRIRRLPMPYGRAAVGAVLYGVLGFGLAYGLLYFALVELTAGTTSVIMASVPLITLLLAVLHRQERLSARGVVGGALAIAGIAVLSTNSLGGELPPAYVLAAVLGAIAAAESSVVAKGFPRTHPVTTNAVGMAAGTVFLVAASLAFGEQWTLPSGARTWAALAWLVVAGSVGLFLLFLFVVMRWTASATTYALTLMPVVAVTLGIVLADERLRVEVVAGGLLVVVAVYVGALGGRRSPRAGEAPEAPVGSPEVRSPVPGAE
ncbi:MAG TPA: EamA family transporter [Actinomycetota bacterium]|nr:EamA family transporter [Actinomycetota bacterium]